MSKGFGPDELLACYARGTFPMADGRDDPRLFLVDPDQRGILPLDQVHIPRRLKRTVRTTPFVVTFNQAFRDVVELCAAPIGERTETWINQPILELYDGLHRRGHGFSVETWHEDQLVGGLYGVRLGAAFFGESMFSRARDASKIALVPLVAHLIAGGFRLLDTQFITDHLTQFGTIEVNRKTYHLLLTEAITCPSTFPVPDLLVPERQEQDLSEALTHLDRPRAQSVPMPQHLDLPRQLSLQSAGALCLKTIEQHLLAQQPLRN
ncbi:MAG: leucyl/phenylalanyl-tRNA--protein transferase [Hyphomonadaceae bacterium]